MESPPATPSNDYPPSELCNASNFHDLYIPAPPEYNRDEAYEYHVVTRSCFAMIFQKPIVGNRLGQALIAVLERLNEYRPNREENESDILEYMDGQGYLDFRECADHALAVLQFAEKFEMDSLWANAFAHCAGMNDILESSREFEGLSRVSKALINRAHLEMDVRLDRAVKSLGTFFEDDLSGAYLGLGNAARTHLERFRSFLHSFYLGRHGYWPPEIMSTPGVFPKSLYLTMYFEFRSLYEYLLDPESTDSFQDNKPARGGLCILQNVKAFDRRHGYGSLPHPLPLIPEDNAQLQTISEYDDVLSLGRNRMALNSFTPRNLVFSGRQARKTRKHATLRSLTKATNSQLKIMGCSLVQEYAYFEKICTMEEGEKVFPADGRKVRWMLIYAILQTLISVTRAPQEVTDTEGVSYPLCCQVPSTLPWKIGKVTLPTTSENESKVKFVIEPDINYASFGRTSSSTSLVSTKSTKSKRSTSHSHHSPTSPISRASTKSSSRSRSPSARLLLEKAGRSLSHQSQSPTTAPKQAVTGGGFCEILVHGYGNGLNPAKIDVGTEPEKVYAVSEPRMPVLRESSTRSGLSAERDVEAVSQMGIVVKDFSMPASRESSTGSGPTRFETETETVLVSEPSTPVTRESSTPFGIAISEPSTPVSRESSTRSGWSQTTTSSNKDSLPDMDHLSVGGSSSPAVNSKRDSGSSSSNTNVKGEIQIQHQPNPNPTRGEIVLYHSVTTVETVFDPGRGTARSTVWMS